MLQMTLTRLWTNGFCATAIAVFAISAGLIAAPAAKAGTFDNLTSSTANQKRNQIRASQFLSKATFGPTTGQIEELGNRIAAIGYRAACEEWIDEQIEMPIGYSEKYFPQGQTHEGMARAMVARNNHALDAQNGAALQNYRYEAWWHMALTSDDQLRQRVAWALSQIFVVGDSGTGFNNRNIYNIRETNPTQRSIPLWLGMSNYYDKLVANSFGSYRDVLGEVTFHPIMGVWLSSLGNQKAEKVDGEITRFPDENYAREIQQLFSVGLYQLHLDGRLQRDSNGDLIPTYFNDGITEMARVFTGMHYSDGDNNDNDFNTQNGRRTFGRSMAVNGNRHDNNQDYNEETNPPSSKTLFKGTAHEQVIVLPGNYNNLGNAAKHAAARQEINDALDIIADHPNVAPFISRLLIQRLVKSNPSRAYIRRVTKAWNDNDGDLAAVVKAILLDSEVLRGQVVRRRREPGTTNFRVEVTSRGTEYSRLREPINRVCALIRAMEPVSNDDDEWFILARFIQDDLGQLPYRSPTVFNYYLPDYQTSELVGYVPSRRNPLGSLFTPEFQILNAVTAIRTMDRMKNFCRNRWSQFNINHGQDENGAFPNPIARRTIRLTFDLDEELMLAGQEGQPGNDYDNPDHNKGNMKDLLERFDLLLCNGSMLENTKRLIYEGLATTPGDSSSQSVPRIEEMLLAIVTSPDCAIEE